MESIINFLVENRTLLIVLAVMAAAFLLLRSQQSDIDGVSWEAVVKTGQPVVVEFFSNT